MTINSNASEFILNCSNNGCFNIKLIEENNLNIYCSNGICNELLIDCTNCNKFQFNCSNNGICMNSILKASNATYFELFCSSLINNHSITGCHNITTYIASQNNINNNNEKMAAILCDYYGCNELNIFLSVKQIII